MRTLPPTIDFPLVVMTPEGREISCLVRRLRRNRTVHRWVFTTELHDLGGSLTPTTFLGPAYVPGEHDDVAAIGELACAWWEQHQEIESPRAAMVRRLTSPITGV